MEVVNTGAFPTNNASHDDDQSIGSDDNNKNQNKGGIDRTRVCLKGVDRYLDEAAVLKFIEKIVDNKVSVTGVTKLRLKTFAIVAFADESEKQKFEGIFKGVSL